MESLVGDKLLSSLPFHWGVFGGAVRDILSNIKPRDIDVAVDCSRSALDFILRDFSTKKNRFGGHKFKFDGTEYDLWPLAETWQLKRLGCPANFRLLAQTAPYNADCIVYSSADGLMDYGWYTCKTVGLQINHKLNPHPMFNAMRGVKMCHKYNLWAGKTFVDYIKEHLMPKINIAKFKYKELYNRDLEEDLAAII